MMDDDDNNNNNNIQQESSLLKCNVAQQIQLSSPLPPSLLFTNGNVNGNIVKEEDSLPLSLFDVGEDSGTSSRSRSNSRFSGFSRYNGGSDSKNDSECVSHLQQQSSSSSSHIQLSQPSNHKSQKFRHYIFTMNNIQVKDGKVILKQKYETLRGAQFVAGQVEQGKQQGIIHLQFIVIFKNNRSLRAVKSENEECHVEACKNIIACYKYVTKKDTRVNGPWQFGSSGCIPLENGGDRRSNEFVLKKQGVTTVADCLQVNLEDENIARSLSSYQYMQIKKIQDQYRAQFGSGKHNEALEFEYPKHEWQIELEKIVMDAAPKRKIMWIKGPGGVGKSEWSEFMEKKFNWAYRTVGGGKSADILYGVKSYHRLVIIDIGKNDSKQLVAEMNANSKNFITNEIYSVAENVKNGVFESTKYVPEKRVLKETPHVVVMANEWPQVSNLSIDRWILWELLGGGGSEECGKFKVIDAKELHNFQTKQQQDALAEKQLKQKQEDQRKAQQQAYYSLQYQHLKRKMEQQEDDEQSFRCGNNRQQRRKRREQPQFRSYDDDDEGSSEFEPEFI